MGHESPKKVNYFTAFFRDVESDGYPGQYYEVYFSSALNDAEETVYSIGNIRKRRLPTRQGSSGKAGAQSASGNLLAILYT